jgi:peptidoglycan hydrolase CwlO-like protein
MKYILEGDEKELGRVLREQRIRIGRGLIKITPISGTLVHEDYALKAIEAQVKELTETLALKDGQIESLTSERDSLRARMTEMEASGSMLCCKGF